MTQDSDELRDRLAKLTPVPFTAELQERIIAAAQRSQPAATTRVRRWTSVAGIAAAAASLALVVAAWTYGAQLGVHQSSVATQAALAKRVAGNGVVSLQLAPVSVGVDPVGSAKQAEVTATLTNVGTQVLQPDQLIGVLSFQRTGNSDPLADSTWVTFVDPPKRPLAPGDTVTWSFRPLGVPRDAAGGFQGVPKLVFFMRGLVDPAKADIVWRAAPLATQRVDVFPRLQWDRGLSFEVRAELLNESSQPVHLADVLALIWFPQPGSAGDWMDPGTTRFLVHVAADGGDTLLAPAAKTTVNFRLIGPPDLDIADVTPNIAFIWR